MTLQATLRLAALPLVLLSGCATPMASTDTAYHQEETVTGTRVPRKTPQGVQSADGDSIRNQRSLGPTTGSVSRSLGSDR